MASDDGWTQVGSKGKKQREYVATKETRPAYPRTQISSLTEIQPDFTTKLKKWQTCKCRKEVLTILGRGQPEDGWDLRKAVCVGIGSFSWDNLECRTRSLWQLAVFVDLVQELQNNTKGQMEIEMFAQELEFGEVDMALLRSMNIRPLEFHTKTADGMLVEPGIKGWGPAKQHLQQDTFFYEPFVAVDEHMVQEIVDADFGLYIGSSIPGHLDDSGRTGDLAKEFARTHEMFKFPRFGEDDDGVFKGLAIYWKSENDDGE